MLVLFWCLGAVLFCWFLSRLAVQSSYYADPRRRFCGTLERFFAAVTRGTNKVFSYRPLRWISPTAAPISEELKQYAGVKQFWFVTVPKTNLQADSRFKLRRDEMARREAETASHSDMEQVTTRQIMLGVVLLTLIGCFAFTMLPVG